MVKRTVVMRLRCWGGSEPSMIWRAARWESEGAAGRYKKHMYENQDDDSGGRKCRRPPTIGAMHLSPAIIVHGSRCCPAAAIATLYLLAFLGAGSTYVRCRVGLKSSRETKRVAKRFDVVGWSLSVMGAPGGAGDISQEKQASQSAQPTEVAITLTPKSELSL